MRLFREQHRYAVEICLMPRNRTNYKFRKKVLDKSQKSCYNPHNKTDEEE